MAAGRKDEKWLSGCPIATDSITSHYYDGLIILVDEKVNKCIYFCKKDLIMSDNIFR